MKINKNKKTLGIIIGASAVALSTIGFASWVISGEIAVEKQNVTVGFGDVTDTSVIGEIITGDTELKLAFDSNADQTGNIKGEAQSKEDLIFKVAFKFTVGASKTLNGVKFDLTNPYEPLVTAGYITAAHGTTHTLTFDSSVAGDYYLEATSGTITKKTSAPAAYIQKHSVTKTANEYKVVSEFKYGWGTKFGGVNPATYDNDKTGAALTTAINNLTAFKTEYGKISARQIEVTINPTLAA